MCIPGKEKLSADFDHAAVRFRFSTLGGVPCLMKARPSGNREERSGATGRHAEDVLRRHLREFEAAHARAVGSLHRGTRTQGIPSRPFGYDQV